MVEMLGVLVVMGVLAITAVWGFRYATENNCANASIPNDYVGLMYGGCVDLNKVNTATCPGSISGIMVP